MSDALELVLIGADNDIGRAKLLLMLISAGAFVGIPVGLLLAGILRRMEECRPGAYRNSWVPLSVLGVGWGIATLWLWMHSADMVISPGRSHDSLGNEIMGWFLTLTAGLYAYPFWVATYWLLKHYPRRELETESQLCDFKHASLFLSVIVLVASIVLIAMYPLRPHERSHRRINDEQRLNSR